MAVVVNIVRDPHTLTSLIKQCLTAAKYVKQLGWWSEGKTQHTVDYDFKISSWCTLSSFFLICNSSSEYLSKFVVFYSMFVGSTIPSKIHQNPQIRFIVFMQKDEWFH